MGQYIDIGIPLTVQTNLKGSEDARITITNLAKAIGERLNIDMSLYAPGEDTDQNIVFNLQGAYFGESLVSFIRKQVEMSSLFTLSEAVAQKLSRLHGVETLEDYIKSEKPDYFCMTWFERTRIEINTQNILIDTRVFSLASAGNILFDGSWKVFQYFAKNIHLQDHPLAKCVCVQVNG